MKTCIVDIDGTLADTSHRQHFMERKPKDFAGWFAVQHNDKPRHEVIGLARALKTLGFRLVLASGREEKYRQDTMYWLERVAKFQNDFEHLYMRATGDFRHDDIVKAEMLPAIRSHGNNPVVAIDDRPRVIRMWRANGLDVIDVGNGMEF